MKLYKVNNYYDKGRLLKAVYHSCYWLQNNRENRKKCGKLDNRKTTIITKIKQKLFSNRLMKKNLNEELIYLYNCLYFIVTGLF